MNIIVRYLVTDTQVCLSLSFLRLLDTALYLFPRVSVLETTRQIRFPSFARDSNVVCRAGIATRCRRCRIIFHASEIASRIFPLSSFLIVPKESLIIRIESRSR